MKTEYPVVYRGDIWMIDWNPSRGSEQQGYRLSLIVQNNAGSANPRYGNVIVVAISSKSSSNIPFHLFLPKDSDNGLAIDSYIKCEQILTVSKNRLVNRIGYVSESVMNVVFQTVTTLLR